MRAVLFRCLLLTFVTAVVSNPAAQSTGALSTGALSIDTLMATPFPTALVAAPTGGLIAWVSSSSGVNNLLVAQGPDHKWKALTSYTADDGQWITEPTFTSDAKMIAFVRGDGANRQGESPNPAQLQDGTEQAVFVVPLTGGAPKRLGPGSGIAASPNGSRIAWVSRGQIWSVDLTGSDAPARLVNARGSASGLKFSPDG